MREWEGWGYKVIKERRTIGYLKQVGVLLCALDGIQGYSRIRNTMKILRSSQELSGLKRDMRIHTGCGERLKGGRKGEEGGG